MAAPKGNIVPQGDIGAAARVTRHRFRAIVDDVLTGLLGPDAMRDAAGNDLVTRLQRECLHDTRTSTAALGELLKLVPADTAAAPGAAGGLVANIGALYLQALQVAPERGYIAGTEAAKPLITIEEW